MINSIVDKVYVITTIDSNRADYIQNHLDNNGIKFEFIVSSESSILSKDFTVVDSGKSECRPALSLLSMYTSIIKMSILNRLNRVCVIEDDCFFANGWELEFNKFYANIPDNNWDIINVGYHPLHDTDTVKHLINDYVYSPKNYHHTAHCMLCSRSIFQDYIDIVKYTKYSIPADYVFNEQFSCSYLIPCIFKK
jgi:hypothetical protein